MYELSKRGACDNCASTAQELLDKLDATASTTREMFEKLRVNKAEVPQHTALNITVIKRSTEYVSASNFETMK